MATNLKTLAVKVGMSPKTMWSLAAGRPGTALSVSCSGSIPADMFIGDYLGNGHRVTESSLISGNRRRQL